MTAPRPSLAEDVRADIETLEGALDVLVRWSRPQTDQERMDGAAALLTPLIPRLGRAADALDAAERLAEAAGALHGFAGLTTDAQQQGYEDSCALLVMLGTALSEFEKARG